MLLQSVRNPPTQEALRSGQGAIMDAPHSSNEQGERVIAASKRPDGTLRKERRVRAGYTPQDEQPVYVSRGAAVSGGGGGGRQLRLRLHFAHPSTECNALPHALPT